MSRTKKFQAGDAEYTKLKVLWGVWADSPAEREFWRAQFSSPTSQADNRALLLERTGIDLKYDKQLTAFRSWLDDQDELDREAERQRSEAARLKEDHPDWTEEQYRSEVISRSMQRAIARGDFKTLGLKAVAASVKVQQVKLDQAKFDEMKRKADQADAATQVVHSTLSVEEQNRRLREILK